MSGKLLRVLVGLGVTAAMTAVSQAGGGTGPATITITDQQTGVVQVGADADGTSVGDREIVHQLLFDRRGSSTAIGHADILCTLLTKTTSTCSGTYQLPKGTIVTSGETDTMLLYEAAIVGGTELYNNARGSLVATTTSLKPRREVLVFRLTG